MPSAMTRPSTSEAGAEESPIEPLTGGVRQTPTRLAGSPAYCVCMTTEREPNPTEGEVETDFSVPADADYATPGTPIDDERHTQEERDEENGQNATPGNPLED
jgi:hypothetical protein